MSNRLNKLPPTRRTQILPCCANGGYATISRVADMSINTVTKLLEQADETCVARHDEKVCNVKASGIRCDEIWSLEGVLARIDAGAPARAKHGPYEKWAAL
jgi:hypothetical protein